MRRLGLGLLMTVAGVWSTGCGATWIQVPAGIVATPEVEIRAEDGTFSFVSGRGFIPPFYADDCVGRAITTNYPLALKFKARRVRVKVPSVPEPLYGILALCRVHPKASGPATRSYRIEVPESYVAQTDQGRVSVVWEETDQGMQWTDGYAKFAAWQLWLSRSPFP